MVTKTKNMILENLSSFLFGVIMTFIFQILFGGNKGFFKLIDEFKEKLPPKQKKAEISYNENIGFQHMNLTKLETPLNRHDLDYLLKQLEIFDYKSIYFKRKEIESYARNIQRLITTTNDVKFCVGILQELF